ncbi:hypothetical protein C8A00DRAFT_17591 [Chaetomidium leptoderma]|uniref:Uncharacterized protein n=1 Tax=Chaetomidium leptoderma TaxID=669021 RepID=A0AAN6ZW13_9PEZI|nr:hypothetical protein C8A00DRAFT_17591 [Chaetomidium leptoderma]
MAPKYFCWRVSLTFGCGCVETTATAHRCGPAREGCNNWLTHKRTDKDCDEHRAAARGCGGGRSSGSSLEGGGQEEEQDYHNNNQIGGDEVVVVVYSGEEGGRKVVGRGQGQGQEGEFMVGGGEGGYYGQQRVV